MKTAFQLLKELWIPLALATLWILYNPAEQSSAASTLRDLVGRFGPPFFFFSWMGAQWFRVQKQIRVDGNLGGIEDKMLRVEQNLGEIEKRLKDLANSITPHEVIVHSFVPPNANKLRSVVRIANAGANPTEVTVTYLKPGSGQPLSATMPGGELSPGSSRVYTSTQIAAALQFTFSPTERPSLTFAGTDTIVQAVHFVADETGEFIIIP